MVIVFLFSLLIQTNFNGTFNHYNPSFFINDVWRKHDIYKHVIYTNMPVYVWETKYGMMAADT